MVETFSRQMYAHIYTRCPGTHIHTGAGKRAHARPLVHTHTLAALNVGHWALLSLKRAETVPKPPLQSNRFRTLKTVHRLQLLCYFTNTIRR